MKTKLAAFVSENAVLRSFLVKHIPHASNLETIHFEAYHRVLEDGRSFSHLFIDKDSLNPYHLSADNHLTQIRSQFPHARIAIWGEEDIRVNQKYIVEGANEFITPSMLTSPLLRDYLGKKFPELQLKNEVTLN